MKKGLIILIIFVFIFSLVGCNSEEDHSGEAKAPSDSSTQEGKDYQEVIKAFKESGFTNIKTEKIEDLIFGWLTKDGEVESVTVDGNEDYSSDVWYPNDVEVIIAYHTFKEREEVKKPQETKEIDDGSEKIYKSAIGKKAIDIYNKLSGLGYNVEFKHAITNMDFSETVLYSSDPDDTEYYIPWVITDLVSLNKTSKKASFLINTQEGIDTAQKNKDTLDILEEKLAASVAWGTVDIHGSKEFPYGFKLNLITGILAETALDEDTWFLKSYCQVKNEYGKWVKGLTCEAKVTGTTDSPKIVDFKVY